MFQGGQKHFSSARQNSQSNQKFNVRQDSHFFNKCGVGVGEDVSLLSSQRAAGDVEVDPQVGVVSFYRHTDVLHGEEGKETSADEKREKQEIKKKVFNQQLERTSAYLDGGDVERRGDAEHGHDDGLVLLVDEDLHVSDVLFSGHLRDVLVGHV